MRPTFQSVTVTIVDVVGIFLAGAVWLVVGWAVARHLSFMPDNIAGLPTRVGLTSSAGSNVSGAFYPLFIGSALILGYVANTFCVGAAEFLVFPTRLIGCLREGGPDAGKRKGFWFNFGQTLWGCLVRKGPKIYFKESTDRMGAHACHGCKFAYPYDAIHSARKYFGTLKELLKDATNLSGEDLPSTQPVAGCRRLLQMAVPTLWAEVERYEAQVRLLAALFVAGTAVFIANLAGYFVSWRTAGWSHVFLGMVVVLLAVAFQKARLREVRYVYLNTLLASRSIAAMLADPKNAAGPTASVPNGSTSAQGA